MYVIQAQEQPLLPSESKADARIRNQYALKQALEIYQQRALDEGIVTVPEFANLALVTKQGKVPSYQEWIAIVKLPSEKEWKQWVRFKRRAMKRNKVVSNSKV